MKTTDQTSISGFTTLAISVCLVSLAGIHHHLWRTHKFHSTSFARDHSPNINVDSVSHSQPFLHNLPSHPWPRTELVPYLPLPSLRFPPYSNADLVEPISNPYYQTESSTRRACQPSQGFLLVIQIWRLKQWCGRHLKDDDYILRRV